MDFFFLSAFDISALFIIHKSKYIFLILCYLIIILKKPSSKWVTGNTIFFFKNKLDNLVFFWCSLLHFFFYLQFMMFYLLATLRRKISRVLFFTFLLSAFLLILYNSSLAMTYAFFWSVYTSLLGVFLLRCLFQPHGLFCVMLNIIFVIICVFFCVQLIFRSN